MRWNASAFSENYRPRKVVIPLNKQSSPLPKFTVIPGWMLRMDLSLAETVIYAVIYQFTRHNTGFFGGIDYLCRVARCSPEEVRQILLRLQNRGLICRQSSSGLYRYLATAQALDWEEP